MKWGYGIFMMSWALGSACAQPSATDGYRVEPYVTGLKNVNAIAFSPGGKFGYEDQLFVGDSRPDPGSIYRVPAPDEKIVFCRSATSEPRSFEFPPIGSSFEGYLYVTEAWQLETYAPDGTRKNFGRLYAYGLDLAFAPDERFRNNLFHADMGGCAVREWTAEHAQSALIGNLPSYLIAGLAFGPGGDWGLDLYVACLKASGPRDSLAIRRVTPAGVMSNFAASDMFGSTNQLAFDDVGYFGCNLFVSDVEKDAIFEVQPDGQVSIFAQGFSFSKTPFHKFDSGDIVFGPDGAMYVADGGAGTVWRIAAVEIENAQALTADGPSY